MTTATGSEAARRTISVLLAALLGLQPLAPLLAGPNEQAVRLHNRLAGVPPSATVLQQMSALISQGNPQGAAQLAMQNSGFYNVTLRNFVAPATNRAQSAFVPLNDYTATVIGMVRDNVPFNTVLSADILYIGNVSGVPAYSPSNNNHYQYLDDHGVDLKSALVQTDAVLAHRHPVGSHRRRDDHRGGGGRVLHRRHQPRDVPLHHDQLPVQRPAAGDGHHAAAGSHPPGRQPFAGRRQPRVPQQLHRLPCRHGSDGAGLRLLQLRSDRAAAGLHGRADAGQVPHQHRQLSRTASSPRTTRWSNRWRSGPNALLGWSSALPGSGNGAKSLGQELENSQAFANCQVQKVFQAMCLRPPSNAADRSAAAQITADFQSGGYNMKQVFAETAVYCMGN